MCVLELGERFHVILVLRKEMTIMNEVGQSQKTKWELNLQTSFGIVGEWFTRQYSLGDLS